MIGRRHGRRNIEDIFLCKKGYAEVGVAAYLIRQKDAFWRRIHQQRASPRRKCGLVSCIEARHQPLFHEGQQTLAAACFCLGLPHAAIFQCDYMSLRRIVGPPSTAIRTIRSYIGAKPRAHFRRHPTNCSLRLPRTTYTPARKLYLQHSNISYTTVGIVLVLSLGGAYFTYQASRDPTSHQDSSPQVSSVTVDNNIAISLYEMAASIPPGRPETLTEEQEQKLREFWSLVLRVFGVVVVEANGAPEQDAATTGPGTPAEPAAEATEKKKKRLGLFRKKEDKEKKKEKEAGKSEKPVAETTNLDSITDADDKYGQNKEFKAAMASKSPEELRAALWAMAKHDNPDGLLLRFLRARKWNPHPALVMLISTMHWRAEEMKVDSDIVLNGEETMIAESAENKDAADFMTQLRMGKSFLHGHDKEGRPMCIVRVRLHHGGEQTEKSLERFTVWTIETARMILRGPVDTATIVFDMSNFSMANMV